MNISERAIRDRLVEHGRILLKAPKGIRPADPGWDCCDMDDRFWSPCAAVLAGEILRCEEAAGFDLREAFF